MSYVLKGKEFKILQNKAKEMGASNLTLSPLKYKKYRVNFERKDIDFGDNRDEDFTIHKDLERRKRYRARASRIKHKVGKLTYLDKSSSNYWAYHLLW